MSNFEKLIKDNTLNGSEASIKAYMPNLSKDIIFTIELDCHRKQYNSFIDLIIANNVSKKKREFINKMDNSGDGINKNGYRWGIEDWDREILSCYVEDPMPSNTIEQNLYNHLAYFLETAYNEGVFHKIPSPLELSEYVSFLIKSIKIN